MRPVFCSDCRVPIAGNTALAVWVDDDSRLVAPARYVTVEEALCLFGDAIGSAKQVMAAATAALRAAIRVLSGTERKNDMKSLNEGSGRGGCGMLKSVRMTAVWV